MKWLVLLLCLGLVPPAAAGERRVRLVDVPLVDAAGADIRFLPDLVRGHLLVLNPIWTGCSSFCPLTSAVMADLAARLGPRLDREVRLVSLAIDPLETPRQQLASWVEDYGSVRGWSWVGGSPGAVEQLLAGLGEPLFGPLDGHPALFLVVDGRTGRTVRFDGLATDAQLLAETLDRLWPAS